MIGLNQKLGVSSEMNFDTEEQSKIVPLEEIICIN